MSSEGNSISIVSEGINSSVSFDYAWKPIDERIESHVIPRFNELELKGTAMAGEMNAQRVEIEDSRALIETNARDIEKLRYVIYGIFAAQVGLMVLAVQLLVNVVVL